MLLLYKSAKVSSVSQLNSQRALGKGVGIKSCGTLLAGNHMHLSKINIKLKIALTLLLLVQLFFYYTQMCVITYTSCKHHTFLPLYYFLYLPQPLPYMHNAWSCPKLAKTDQKQANMPI